MAQTTPPKTLTTPTQRFEENSDSLQNAVLHTRTFFEANRTAVIGGTIAVVALIAAVVGYMTWQSNHDARAEEALGTILSLYQAGDFEGALEGTDDSPGLLEIADQYGGATAAPFFAGDALFQLGRFEEALPYFEMVDADGIVGASALAGQAAVQEEQGDNAAAASLYERAASAYASAATAPGYLLGAGRAHAAAGDAEAAAAAYQTILDDYPDTPEATTAEVELAQAEATASATGTPTGDVTAAPVDTTAAAPAAAPVSEGSPLFRTTPGQ